VTDEEDGLAVYMSMHHDKHATLESLKIAFSASYWYHLDDIVPKYDGDTTVLRGLHVVVFPFLDYRESSCLLRIVLLRQKMLDCTDNHT
jgi:hypothetical protein